MCHSSMLWRPHRCTGWGRPKLMGTTRLGVSINTSECTGHLGYGQHWFTSRIFDYADYLGTLISPLTSIHITLESPFFIAMVGKRLQWKFDRRAHCVMQALRNQDQNTTGPAQLPSFAADQSRACPLVGKIGLQLIQ